MFSKHLVRAVYYETPCGLLLAERSLNPFEYHIETVDSATFPQCLGASSIRNSIMEVVSLIIWLFSLILVYFSYSIFCLSLNYRIASKIGVPLVIIPVSPENPFWMLFGNKIASLIQSIFGESHFTRFAIRGWVYYDKSRVALELGGCFAFVTPDKIWFYVCDREVLNDVVQRRNDFPRPLELLCQC